MAKTISHRELRNHSGEVLREVAQGESYDVTNHGEVVARLVPPASGAELRCIRPATTTAKWAAMARESSPAPSGSTLDELREERR